MSLRSSQRAPHASFGGILAPYYPRTKGERTVFVILLLISAITLVALGIFYLLNPRAVLGESLVTTSSGAPMEFPPIGTFPFYVKPVTIMFVSLVAFSYCFLGLTGETIERRLPRVVRLLFLLIFVVTFAACAYEVMFNFTLWGSILVNKPDPDLAVNIYPLGGWQTSLVFATKAYLSLLFVSWFALSTFRRSLETES